MSDIEVEVRDGVAVLTLNRPERMNALTMPMVELWAEQLKELQADPSARVIVVTGAGRGFCSGFDLSGIRGHDEEAGAVEFKSHIWDGIYQVARALRDVDKPVIAAMNGSAIGAGLDMGLMCDLRIASDTAKFSQGYIKLGLIPGDGGPYFLPRLVGQQRALELMWTGRIINGVEAKEIGMVLESLPAEEVLPRALELATEIAARANEVVRATKRLVYECASVELGTALELISSQAAIMRLTDESRAARDAFLAQRLDKVKA